MNGLHCETAQCSLLGNRQKNEDRHLLLQTPDAILAVVADGMGGHPKGELAAQILIEVCRHRFNACSQPITDPAGFLEGLIIEAQQRIVDFGRQHEPPIQPCTTAVVCLLQQDEAYWVHVGDSRFYLIRNGLICRRTRDHSYVQQLESQGLLNKRERGDHPYKNYVTRCLGGQMCEPKLSGKPYRLEVGDVLLLCSDGFWGQIDEQLLVQTLANESLQINDILQRLSRLAEKSAYPKSDNVTAIALRWRVPNQRDELLNIDFANSVVDGEQKPGVSTDDALEKAIDTLREAIDNFEIENL